MADTSSSSGQETAGERVVIKKYANRRLYNTASSSYVTLEHLADMVKKGVDFVVYDAKTNEDITRTVLTQIIFEEEEKSQGQSLLPIQFLRQLISFYGNSMQAFLPSYLEMSLDTFSRQQEEFQKQFASGRIPGFQSGFMGEQARKNMQMFEQAMRMFTPFNYGQEQGAKPAADAPAAPAPEGKEAALEDLKAQLSAMQAQLNKLASKE